MATKQKKQNKPGAPTLLTKLVAGRIRTLIVSGKEREEICAELGIKVGTWDKWYYRDSSSFRVNLENWREEFMLKQARINHRDFLIMPTDIEDIEDSDDENGPRSVVRTDPRLLKIKSDHTIYITDTLGKEKFSKKLITEDPNAAKKDEVEALRESVKKIMNNQRMSHKSGHKQKMEQLTK